MPMYVLQELKILEMLPFDRRIVQLYGSCTHDNNILLVLELMEVIMRQCKVALPGWAMLLQTCIK